MIDKLDMCQIGLKDLCIKFGIIFQDFILFEGIVCSNIDFMYEYIDFEIWEVFEKCQLVEIIKVKNDKFDFVGKVQYVMVIFVLLNCFGCEMICNFISINLCFVDLFIEFFSFIVIVVENGDNWSVG